VSVEEKGGFLLWQIVKGEREGEKSAARKKKPLTGEKM